MFGASKPARRLKERTDMYGKLGRVGVATPFGGEIIISDMYRYLHPDIQVAEVPILFKKLTKEGLEELSGKVVEGMSNFPLSFPIDLAYFSCTTGSQIGGAGFDKKMCEAMKSAAQSRGALTTTTALLQALRAVGSKKLSIVTPYPDEINDMEKAYLEHEGFQVVSINGIKTENPTNPMLITKIPEERTFDFALRYVSGQADTLLISCCGLHSMSLPAALEKKIGIPVLTSNQCAVWAVGKFFGAHGPKAQELGSLFDK